MSNYHRFYIKTNAPKDIIAVLRCTCSIDISLEYITVNSIQDGYIIPDRELYGDPVISNEVTDWYLLDSNTKYGSDAASLIARTLIDCGAVELAAEDNECGADDQASTALIVDDSHWLFDKNDK